MRPATVEGGPSRVIGNGQAGTEPGTAFGPRLRALREAAGLTQEGLVYAGDAAPA